MAAETYEALNRMLEASLRKRQIDVSESLAMMQLAQAAETRREDVLFRQAEFEQRTSMEKQRSDYYTEMARLAGVKQTKEIEMQEFTDVETRLIGLENMNKTQSLVLVANWVDSIGIRYSDADDWGSITVDVLSEKPKKGGPGFSEENAVRLMNVVSDAENNDHVSGLKLLHDINTALSLSLNNQKLSPSQWNLLKGFTNLGMLQGEVFKGKPTGRLTASNQFSMSLSGAETMMENQAKLTQELKDLYLHRDLIIQSDLSSIEKQQVKTAISAADFMKNEAINKANLERFKKMREKQLREEEALLRGLSPEEFEEQDLRASIASTDDIIDAQQDSLDTSHSQMMAIKSNVDAGFVVDTGDIDNIADTIERLAGDIKSHRAVRDSLNQILRVDMPVDRLLEDKGLSDTPENRKVAEDQVERQRVARKYMFRRY